MAHRQIRLPPNIDAVSKLTALENLGAEFSAQSGYAPELISHWNPKPAFSSQIESWLVRSRATVNLIDYAYPCDIPIDSAIRTRLHEQSERNILLTPSGTTSVVNACAYLKNTGTKRLIILTPAYFTIEAVAGVFEIAASYIGVRRKPYGYELPQEIIIKQPRDTAVWLTLPVYGASIYFTPEDVASLIDALPPDTIVVVDETLAYSDRPSLLATKTTYRVIRISTPHKALCINGEKVSFVTFPAHLSENMDAWSSCFAGGIGAAGVRALAFIADRAYDRALTNVRALTRANLAKLEAMIRTKPYVCADKDTDGYFVMLYWPALPASLGEDKAFIAQMLAASGALPIPSSRNRHPPECGFSFRVNLFRLDDAALGATSRLIDAIGAYVRDRLECRVLTSTNSN
jgi:histidinol-phosphate/aromatic aminotransferase/cobyric acid decarboxylase-like protein